MMHGWKIRTKMIAVLCLLSIAIGALVLSSWSQMSRDRLLAIEIGDLNKDFDYASGLVRWSEGLHRSYFDFDDLVSSTAKPGNEPHLIPRRPISEEIADAMTNVDFNFEQLHRALDTYRTEISRYADSGSQSSVPFNRAAQAKQLALTRDQLDHAHRDWQSLKGVERDSFFMSYYSADLSEKIPQLHKGINSHFGSIKNAMGGVENLVNTEHRAKRRTFWILTLVAFSMILTLAWMFWTSIVVPFRTLIKGSELIANGHHKHQILLGTNDELGLMAETINQITNGFNEAVANATNARIRAEQEVRERTREVIQNEQLASVGFLAAGVAHEINNPLGAIAWSAEALEETLEELTDDERDRIGDSLLDELRTNLGLIQSEAFRCKGITERLLSFARLSNTSREVEDLCDLVQRVISMVAKVGKYRCKTIEVHASRKIRAYCNAQEIQQVVLNLVSNALESVDTDGRVDVYVRDEYDRFHSQYHAVVSVEDDGCGMTQDVMDHLFEPFFTRRRDNSGTGLGLSISARIVSLHHGSLTAHSDGEGCGSKMVLRLPIEAPKEIPAPASNTLAIAPPSESDSETTREDVEKVARM
ncbi:sensor histidine kinase [Roseiconus lacunae]|nr:HAMP domain-containing sensor histidine kinase [Roseiconus lacunae]MCD0459799.1 HAMP domain-containing histidine kinase [Roseiconus lacunae]